MREAHVYILSYILSKGDIKTMNDDNLMDAQRSLEQKGLYDGMLRFRKRLGSSDFSDTKVGLEFLNTAVLRFSGEICNMLSLAPKENKNAPQSAPKYILRSLLQETFSLSHPDEIAFCVSKVILDISFVSLSLSESLKEKWGNYSKIVKAISDAFNRHHNFCLFKAHPDWSKAERHLSSRSKSLVHRERMLTFAMRQNTDIKYRTLTEDQRYILGVSLLESFVESTGLVYITNLSHPKGKGRGPKHVRPHPQTLEYLQRMNKRLELMEPICYPSVIPSIPWDSSDNGGFLSNDGTPKGFNIRFIRSSKSQNAIAEQLPSFRQRVTRVADILGSTPFRINKRIQSILQTLVNNKSPLLSEIIAPAPEDLSPPGKPWTTQDEYDDLKRTNPEIIKQWKRKAAAEYDRVLGSPATSLRVKIARQLMLSNTMEKYPQFYFPHNVDFRGRYYPMTPYVNPQGDDTGKSLIELANPSEITDENLKWFLVHGANLWGKDKVSFRDRVEFTSSKEFIRDILRIQSDPIGTLDLWCKTDSPMMFLSWALEYADVISGKSKVTHQVISMDGTCNGLQHYSALLRDPIGAASVNLCSNPLGKPADVYSDIAKRVQEIMKERQNTDESARYWVNLITRKVVKRNVMTTPYGVTKFGMRDQLNVELKKIEGMPMDYRRHTLYLSRVIYEALGTCIQSAQTGMDYLRYVAKEYMGNNLDVSWVTPLGLHVTQEYFKFQTKTINLWQGQRALKIMRIEDTNEINKRKNQSAFPPNFIHSLDASHLGFTVLDMHDKHGIRDFSMVHDSFGTSLSHVETMNKVLREQFIRLYTEFDPLESLRESFSLRTNGKTLEPAPKKGAFDINKVLTSEYFFM